MRDRLHRVALRCFGALPRGVRSRVIRLIAPKFTAGAIVAISDGDGHVLLVSHPYSKGWGMPGGYLKGNEMPARAVAREVGEELGLVLQVEGHPLAIPTSWRAHYNFLFVATIERIDPASLRGHSPEISGVDWFSLDDLPPLSEMTDVFLEAVGLVSPDSSTAPA